MRPDDRGQRKAGRIWQWEPESLMFYVYNGIQKNGLIS